MDIGVNDFVRRLSIVQLSARGPALSAADVIEKDHSIKKKIFFLLLCVLCVCTLSTVLCSTSTVPTYHKLTFIIEDLLQLAILRKQLLKSGEKQCICIFAVLNLAHKHVQLNEFCSDFNSETSSELLPLRSTIINLLFFFSKKIFFFLHGKKKK